MAAIANPKHRNLLVILTLTAFVAVGLISSVALAQKEATTREAARASGKQRLSEVLPEKLGAFVLKTGADKDLEAADVAAFLEGEADLDAIVKLLRPVDVVELTFAPMTVVGMSKGKKSGNASKAGQPLLIAVSNVILDNGAELKVGEPLFVGDTIVLGFVINTGKDDVILTTNAGEEVVVGMGVLLRAGGCTSVDTCDADGNCTSRCEGSCTQGQCVRVTVDNPNGGTRSWCECLNVHPPK